MSDETIPRGRVRLFGTLCALVFLINLARIVFAPLLEPFRGPPFFLSKSEVGLIATMAWMGSALPRLPTGLLLTRVPRHRVVLGTGVVLTGASVFTATATTPLMIYAGALTMGLASGSYFIAANPLVSELFPDQVGRAIGIHGTASQVAAAGASLFVGAVLALASWREVFWIMAAATATVTVALYLAARTTDLPAAGDDDRHFLQAVVRQWPIIVTGVAIIGVAGFVWNGLFNFYVTYLVETKAVTEPMARNLLTVVFTAGIPAFWFTGRIADRFSHVPLLLVVLGGIATTILVLTVTYGLWPLVAVSAALGYVMHSLFPALDTYLLASLPDQHRASAYAVFSATMMLIQATGSFFVGQLTDAGFAFDYVFQVFAGGLLVVLGALVGLYLAGWLPTGARSASAPG